MTIHIPEKNIFDKILSCVGKKRGLVIPDKRYDEFGHYVYFQVDHESFWKALIRPVNAPLPKGILNWNTMMDTLKMNYHRREILFCHDLLSFVETEFPNAIFKDDLLGQSRADIYFIYKNAFYLLEAKSETESSKHPGWQGSFQEVRDAIRNLNFDNRYNKWLLYLAQLNNYALSKKCARKSDKIAESYVILALPLPKLSDCQEAIRLTLKRLSMPDFNYISKQNNLREISYILMQKSELSTFIQSIKKNN